MTVRTLLDDCFIRGVFFSSDRKFVFSNSHPESIFVSAKTFKQLSPESAFSNALIANTPRTNEEAEETPGPICMAHQAL